MRVECATNRPEVARKTQKYLGKGTGNNLSTYLLTVGKAYTVYAIAKIKDETLLLIIDDAQDEKELLFNYGEPDPMWYDAKLFKVIDDSIDANWVTKKGTPFTAGGETQSFPEFITDHGFQDKLFDGSKHEVEVFLNYVKKYNEQIK